MTKLKKFQSKLLSFDRFAEKVPGFNFRSKGSMGTWFGLGVSCFFWLLLTTFGVVKLIRLVTGSNPLISASPELDFYGVTDVLDLADPDIEMLPSFQVTDFYS
jgi:hypothetical protein